jgi:hypothetical protein
VQAASCGARPDRVVGEKAIRAVARFEQILPAVDPGVDAPLRMALREGVERGRQQHGSRICPAAKLTEPMLW